MNLATIRPPQAVRVPGADNNATADRSAGMLLEQAAGGLRDARLAGSVEERFGCARLAALRAAAAVLARRALPAHRANGEARSRPRSIWVLLAAVAPELGEWSAFFASASTQPLTARAADDMVRQTAQFLELARAASAPRRRPGRH